MIGTGSSAIQSIPIIAEQAARAHRVPAHRELLGARAQRGRSTTTEKRAIKADYPAFRAREQPDADRDRLAAADRREPRRSRSTPDERERVYEERWEQGGLPFLGAFIDLLFDRNANETAAEFVRAKIREIVNDPDGRRAACRRRR